MSVFRRFARLAGFVALLAFVIPSPARAEEPAPSAAAASKSEPKLCPFCKVAAKNDASYQEKAGNTFVRAAMNFGFGWTEVITQPAREVQGGGNAFAGMINGFGRALGRTAGGIGELATFWTPKLNDQYLHFNSDCPLDPAP